MPSKRRSGGGTAKSEGRAASQTGPASIPAVAPISAEAVHGLRGPHLYNAVVGAAELKGIRLAGAGFEVKPKYFAMTEAEGEAIRLSYDREMSDYAFDDEVGLARATFTWRMSAELDTAKLVSTTASYVIVYSNLAGKDPKAAKSFIKRVGAFATYPYFRAFVSQLDWSADTRLPPMPVLRESVRPSDEPEDEQEKPPA
jgi:hypothetical protein